MQTFLPYPDFAASAAVLDDRRLGKQRVEALQIVRALTWDNYGWQHHPAILMWAGYAEALGAYGLAVCAEWVRRGRPDTCAATITADLAAAGQPPPQPQAVLADLRRLPPWLGDERFHTSHQAALLRKDGAHYAPLFGTVDPELPYFWPVRKQPRRPLSPRETDGA